MLTFIVSGVAKGSGPPLAELWAML